MADKDKVYFGFSELHVGTYEYDPDTKTVTLGTPYHQIGAVGFSPEPSDNDNTFYADDIAFFTDNSSPTRSGDLEVAKFDDEFKTTFLGYVTSSNGGIAEVVNPIKPNVYIAFELKGDAEGRRVIMYNGTLGSINREYSTIEESREPVTESVPVKFIGDTKSGIIVETLKPGDAGYEDLFTDPTPPTIAGGSQ